MLKLLLFSGLFVLSLCLPKDLSSQSDTMEFYGTLESQFLLTDKNSRTNVPSDTQHPQNTSEMRNRVQRAVGDLLSDEGSGMLEETTTVSPATTQAAATETTTTMATTTTTQSPVTTATTTTTTTEAATQGPVTPTQAAVTETTTAIATTTTTQSPVTAVATTTTTTEAATQGPVTTTQAAATETTTTMARTTQSPVTTAETTTTTTDAATQGPVTTTLAAATETTTTMATTTTTQSPVTNAATTTTTEAATQGPVTTTTTLAPTTTEVSVTTTTTTMAPTTTTTATTNAPTTTQSPVTAAATTTTTTVAPTTTTTTTTTTTIATTTTATSSTPRFIVGIRMLLLNAFISDYNNPQSSAYQQQAASVISWCTPIYRRRYGAMFVRVVVISLRSSIRYRQANTEAEIQVEFDQDAPENAPTSSDVALAIKEEASSTTNPIDVDINNVEVTRAPQVMSNAQFTTSENFVLSLLSINSTVYRNRSALIKEELEPFFHEDYSPDFICLTPETFSVGTVHSNSILHQSELHFTYNATLPSATDVHNTMLRAARSGKLSINIISVNGEDVSASSSGDVSSKISLFTTCSLTLLSLLLIRSW